MATVEKWACPKCDFVYESPTRLLDITHPCPSKHSLDNVRLKKVKK